MPTFTVRPACLSDCAAVARIQLDSYRGTYASLLPGEYLDSFSYLEQEQDWEDRLKAGRGLLLVAEADPGRPIGYLLAEKNTLGVADFDCEVTAIYVDRAFHRQGVGRLLMVEAARRLHAQGCRSLGLWMMDGNPAAAFYERLGGQPAGERFFEVEELNLRRKEVGYFWSKIEDLFTTPGIS